MSIHQHPSTASRTDSARRKPRVTVAQLILRAVQRWQRRRAIAELQRLGDRQLHDIGLARSEIPSAVEGLFHRREDTSRRYSPPAPRNSADQRRKAA